FPGPLLLTPRPPPGPGAAGEPPDQIGEIALGLDDDLVDVALMLRGLRAPDQGALRLPTLPARIIRCWTPERDCFYKRGQLRGRASEPGGLIRPPVRFSRPAVRNGSSLWSAFQMNNCCARPFRYSAGRSLTHPVKASDALLSRQGNDM